MNTGAIQTLVAARSGTACRESSNQELERVAPCLEQPDLAAYLRTCLPAQTYAASGVRFHPLTRIVDELLGSPGQALFPYGYLPIATSIGGNAVVTRFGPASPAVFWAAHTGWYDGIISYQDRSSRTWTDLHGYTPEHIERALILLNAGLEEFLLGALSNQLSAVLDALD